MYVPCSKAQTGDDWFKTNFCYCNEPKKSVVVREKSFQSGGGCWPNAMIFESSGTVVFLSFVSILTLGEE